MSALSVLSTNSSSYTAVLYLRDRIDPSALAQFPPLSPAVGDGPPVAVPDDAWNEWVAAIASAPAGGPMVEPRAPELASAYADRRQEIGDWAATHVDDSALSTYRPSWLPKVLGAKGGDGQFACEVLPVAGVWWTDISPRRLLVSQEAYGDHSLMDRLLTERLTPLLT